MLKSLFSFSILILLSLNITAQDEDTVLIAQNTPFIRDLLERKLPLQPIIGKEQGILKPQYPYSKNRGQVLYRTDKGLFLFLDGTGKLYQATQMDDTSITFKRIDITYNMNYAGGGLLYEFEHTFHIFGGYGFWKNNGTDKKFNPLDRQWDVYPLSEEVIPQINPLPLAWHDPVRHTVFVPFQSITNFGIVEPEYQTGKIIPYTYALDIGSRLWKKLGKVDPASLKIMRDASVYLYGESGLYLYSNGNLYLLEYRNNRILKMGDFSVTQSFIRIPPSNFRYAYQNKIYHYNPDTHAYDSLGLPPTQWIVLTTPLYTQENNLTILIVSGLVLIILILFIVRYFNKKKKAVSGTQSPAEAQTEAQTSYTDIELNLINLLKHKREQKVTANLAEINYILGVRDKNIGLQKKVRSEVICSVNAKHKKMTGKETPLIQSVRSENDKRYFEYFLASDDN